MKNYNNELEIILEKKSFSVDVKNILLNMLYKIETSYEDYFTVKRNVEDKKIFIEKILNTIEECNEITLMKTSQDEDKDNIYTKFKIDKENNKIEVYPNEEAMLYALNNFKVIKMYLNDDYKLIRHLLPKILNLGIEINNTEIIRDFDAWSWNVQTDEIKSIEANLVYQNIQILLGYKKLNELLENKELKTTLLPIEKCLEEMYGKENTEILLETIYKLSIIVDIKKDEEERIRLLEEKERIEKEFLRLDNKTTLLEDIANKKKKILNKIKEIDIILNNNEKLLEEYKKRNEKLSEHSKIFSLSHFSEILQRERNQELEKIDKYNKMIDPKNYTFNKINFEKQLSILKDINFEEKNKNTTSKLIVKLQEIFLDCFNIQINNVDNKKDLINLMYIFRYYIFLPIDKNKNIKDCKSLKNKLLNLEKNLVEKLYLAKIVNRNIDFNIIDSIFYTKIISLENIEFEIESKNENNYLILFDEETIAEKIEINDIDISKLKLNKKMKLFN